MGLVYPGSLGVDEGLAHLTMKASVAMLDSCKQAGECGGQHLALLLCFVVVWTAASVATLWWLRRVFSRYETTQALPVEYGAVNAVSACSGLVFYREASLMKPWQLALTIAALLTILTGIAIGRLVAEQPEGGGKKREEGSPEAPRVPPSALLGPSEGRMPTSVGDTAESEL